MSMTQRAVPYLLSLALFLLPAPAVVAGKPGSAPAIATNPLAQGPGAKILTNRDGWYRVSRQELIDTGWDPGSAPADLQLWSEGVQQAILVSTGADAALDPADTIEFFGTGLDSPSTGTRVYWLVRGGSAGLRVASPSSPRGRAASTRFDDTVSFEPKAYYAPGVSEAASDGFYGDAVTSAPVTETIALADLDTTSTGTGSIEVTLQGAPSSWSHEVGVQVNGHAAGTLSFLYQARQTSSYTIPSGWLLDGPNAVTLTALDGAQDVSLLASIRLTYPRLYRAAGDTLTCSAPGTSTVTIGGFSSGAVRVFDVTTPTAPAPITVSMTPASGSYAATFAAPGNAKSTVSLLAVGSSAVLSPAAIVANAPTTLAQSTNQADLVIIAAASLVPAAAPLAALRESEGMRVASVDVTDVYDTFSYGEKDPGAIRRFLQFTRTGWAKAPRYVLLIGAASLDPRGYLGLGDLDLLPTRYIATSLLRTSSDDWFVDFDEDGLPDMAIGRIPARTLPEAATAIAKITGYGQSTGAWTSRVLMVADQNDTYNDFEGASASVTALIPSTFASQSVLAGQVGASAAATAISTGFDSGQLVVNDTGHGLDDAWSFSHLFSTSTVPALSNLSQLPLVVSMTCLTGYFQDPTSTSLAASTLLSPTGGAVAFWGSSGMTNIAGETAMNQQLFRILLDGSRPTLGEAVARAKAATSDQEVRKTWILFGDPSMRLAR